MSLLMSLIMQKIQRDQQLEDENRNVTRNLLTDAVKRDDPNAVSRLVEKGVSQGIDVGTYAGMLSRQPPSLMQQLTGTTSQQKQQAPFPEAAVDFGNAQAPVDQPIPVENTLRELFDDQFVARAIAKRETGINIGDITPQQKAQYFQTLQGLRTAAPQIPMSEHILDATSELGYQPPEVAHLKDLSTDERKALTDQMISQLLADPDLEAAVKRNFPNADQGKVKLGMILNQLSKDRYIIDERYQPFLDQFRGVRGAQLSMEQEEIINKKLAEETAAQATFKGELGRKATEAQTMREINKPHVPQTTVEKVAGTQTILDIVKGNFDNIMKYVKGPSGQVDINRLPTGVGEVYRKRMDKYGIDPEAARIELRVMTVSMLKAMYQMAGKQLSDREMEVNKAKFPQMEDSPTQFVTKISSIQKELISEVQNNIKAFEAAEYDTAGLKQMAEQLEQTPILNEFLRSAKTDQLTKGKIYRDAQGRTAKYLGDGQWQMTK